MQKIRVAVTGGSGFLGQHVVRELQQWQARQDSEEHEVNVRSPYEKKLPLTIEEIVVLDLKPFTPDVEITAAPPVSFYRCDVQDSSSLNKHLQGVTVVIHCAAVLPGILKEEGPPNIRKVRDVNLTGTQNVIEACRECKVKALICTGTMSSVIGGQKIVDQTEPLTLHVPESQLTMGEYGRVRKEEEKAVLQAHGSVGRDGNELVTTVVKPGWLFGEGDKALIPYFVKLAMKNGKILPQIGGWFSVQQLTYAGNAAYGHVCAMLNLLQPQKEDKSERTCGGLVVYINDNSTIGQPNAVLYPFLSDLKLGLGAAEAVLTYHLLILITMLLNLLNALGLFSVRITHMASELAGYWILSADVSSMGSLLMQKLSKFWQMQENKRKDQGHSIQRLKKSKLAEGQADIPDAYRDVWLKSSSKNYRGVVTAMPLAVHRVCRSSLFVSRMRAELRTHYNPIYTFEQSFYRSMGYYRKQKYII